MTGYDTVYVISPATIEIALNKTMICSGGEITLNATVTPAQGGSYQWYRNNVQIAGANTATLHDSPVAVDDDSTAYQYGVVFVSDIEGCVSTKDTVVYAYPNPTVVIEGDPIICSGSELELTANLNGYDTTLHQLSYQWMQANRNLVDGGDISGATTTKLKIQNMADSTDAYIFTVQVSDTNGCRVLSAEYPVYVNDSLHVVVTFDDTTICAGGDVTFYAALADNNATSLVYNWTVDGSVIAGATTSSLTYTFATAAAHTVKAEVAQTTSGCTATDSVKFTVNSLPEVKVEADNDTICSGYQVRLAATPTSGTGVAGEPYEYTWYINGVQVSGATDSVLYDNPTYIGGTTDSMVYVYGVSVRQPSSACESAIATDTIWVIPQPTLTISGDAYLCDAQGHDTVRLYAHLNDQSVSTGTLGYTWRLNNTDLSTSSSDVLTANDTLVMVAGDRADEAYVYTVTAEMPGTGCRVTSEPYYVYVHDTVLVEVTSTVDTLCAGGEVTFTANLGDNNATNIVYRWSELTGTDTWSPIHGATHRTLTVNPTRATSVYKVDVMQTTSECAMTGYDTVYVITAPDIEIALNRSVICSGGEISLNATVTPAQGGSYQWYKNGVQIAGANTARLNDSPIAVDGDSTAYQYGVVFTSDIEGCVSTKDTVVYAYPNPTIAIEGDPIICDGADVVLHANINGYDTTTQTVTYQWMLANRNLVDGADIAGATTNALTYKNLPDSTDAYIFTVQVTDTNGCRILSSEYPVYINDSIVVAVIADDTTICNNGEVTLTAVLGDYNDDALVYQWYTNAIDPANAIAGATERTLTTTVSTTTTYYVKVTQTTSACVATGHINVNAVAPATIAQIKTDTNDMCSGYDLTITASANGGITTEPYIFTWYKNGVLIEGVTDSVFHDATVISGTEAEQVVYSAVVSQPSSNCESARTFADAVIVRPLPAVVISGDQMLCEGSVINLLASVSWDHNFMLDSIQQTWYLNNAPTGMAMNPISPVFAYSEDNIATRPAQDEPYTYTIKIDLGAGCTVMSDPYDVFILAAPVAAVTVDDTTICKGGVVNLMGHIDNYNIEDLTYQWFINDVNTPIAGANEITYTSDPIETATTYYLVVKQTTTLCADTVNVTITPKDAPVIAQVEISEHNICQGAQVTVTASVSGGVENEPYTFTWYRNGVLIDNITDSMFIDNPSLFDYDANSFVYTAVASQPSSACSSTAVSDTLKVYDNPTVVISGDALLCNDSITTLTAHVNDTALATGIVAYQWRLFNTDIVDSTNATITISHQAADEPYIYTVEITNANGCRSISEPYAVYVNRDILVEVTASNDTICAGADVILTANLGDYNSENLTYRWYTTDGATETFIYGATSRTLTVHPNATTNYKVRVFQTTTLCEAVGYDTVTVISLDTINLALTPSDVICDGGEITITADITGRGTYTWYRNGQVIPGATLNTVTDSPLAVDGDVTEYTYALVYIPEIPGCIQPSIDTVVTVYPNHTVTITGDPIICNGNNVELTANVNDSIATSTYTYQWMLANTNIASATGVTLNQHYESSDNPYIFTVKATNGITGCSSVSEPFYVYVNDTASIQVVVTATDTAVCPMGVTTLTANIADNNANNLTYIWKVNGTVIPGATQSTYTATVDATSTYSVEIGQTTSGCSANGNIIINVFDMPSIALTTTEAVVCEGGQVTLTATPASTIPAELGDVTYTWFDNGQLIAGVTGDTYTVTPVAYDNDNTVHNYTVMATAQAPACQSAMSNAATVTVMPNPVVLITSEYDTYCVNTDFNIAVKITGNFHTTDDVQLYVDNGVTALTPSLIMTTGPNSWEFEYTDMWTTPRSGNAYNYQLIVTNANGCSVRSNILPINILAPQNVVVSLAEDTICFGGTAVATANVENPNANVSYSWKINEQVVAGAFAPTFATSDLNEEGLDTLTVIVTDLDSRCESVASAYIQVNRIPAVDQIVMSEDTVCDGYVVEIAAVPNNTLGIQGGAYTYTWYKNGYEITGANDSILRETAVSTDGDTAVYVYGVVISQENSGCVSEMKTDTLYVFPNPTVQISGDQIICEDSVIMLTANVNDTVNGMTYNYEWRLFNETIRPATAAHDTIIYAATPTDQPYIFTVAVTNARGCAVVSEPYSVYVNDSIKVEVTANHDSICAGGEVILTANLIDYNDEMLTYRWSEYNAATGQYDPIWGATSRTLVQHPTATPDRHMYKVNILQTNSGCVAEGFDTVKIISAADIVFTEVSDTNICFGGEVVMKVTHYTNGYYTWYKNGQQISGANLDTYMDSPVAVDGDSTAYIYSVIYTPNIEGCVSERIDTTIYVFPNPAIQISGDAIVCDSVDGNIFLHAYVDSANHFDNLDLHYQWYESNNELVGQNGDTLRLTAGFRDEPYLYTVKISNDRGCTSLSEQYAVYVNDSIFVEVTASADTVCQGAEVTLTAHLFDYNSDHLTYRWESAPAGTSNYTPIWGATERTLTTTIDGTTYFRVNVTQSTSLCYAAGYDTITVYTLDTIMINLEGSDTICSGGEIVLNVTDNHGNALDGGTYSWTRNGVVIEGAYGPTILESPLAVDGDSTRYVYGVTYFPDYAGCRVDAADTAVIVYGNPTVQISGDPIICNVGDNNSVLVANVNDTANYPISYQWRLANRDIPGATSDTLKSTLAASDNPYLFTVQISNNRGCTTLSDEFPVYVNDTASIQVVITSDYDSVCIGGEVTFRAHLADYNSRHLTFQWYKHDTTSTGLDTLIAIDYGTEPWLTYVMTDSLWNKFELHITQTNSGCTAVGTDSVYVWPRTPYEVFNVTAVNVATNSHQICDGGEVDVTVAIRDLYGNPVDSTLFTYEWYRNGFEHPFLHGPWFRESPLTVDDDTTHYVYSTAIVLDIPGCRYSNRGFSDTITVTRNPVVVIGGNPYICEYDQIRLNAFVNGRQDPLPSTTYSWYLDGEYRDNPGSSLLYFYNEPHASLTINWEHTVTVEVVDANGCSNWSDPFHIVVYKAPVTHIVATEDTICDGGEVTMTATLEDYNLDFLVYQWYKDAMIESNRILGAHEPVYTARPDASTTYYVEVYSTLGSNDEPRCTAIDTFHVEVVADPVVNTVEISDTSVCDGGQVTIVAHATGGVPSDEYVFTWYRNNELIEGVTDSVFTESPLTVDGDITTYVYSASVSQASSGCQSIRTFATNTLTVYPNPTVVIAGDPIICEDSVIMLSANVTNDYMGAELTYTWLLYNDTIRAAAVAHDTIIDVRGPQDYAYIYTVVVDNPHGCRVESAPYYVYVNDTIIVEVTSTENDICEGGQVTLTANIGDYNDTNLTYRWYKNGTDEADQIWGATQSTYTTTVDDTTVFFVRVFQTNSACETFGFDTIFTHPDPVIDTIVLSVYEICEGGQVTVTAHASEGVEGFPYIFTWYRNNELMEGYTDSTFTVSDLTVDGDITDYVFSATVRQTPAGCESVRAYADTLTVNPNPYVVISGDPQICQDSVMVLTANVTNNYDGAELTYTWKLDNDTITDADGNDTTLTLTLDPRDHAYNFTVVVANAHGCTSESAVFSVVVNPRPVVEVTAYEETICRGGNTVLTANIDNYNLNNLMYRWYTATGDIYGGMQRVITVEPTDTTMYYVEVYQVGSECRSYDSIRINVNDIPVIDTIELSVYEICDGGQVTVTAHAHGGVDVAEYPYIYTWYRNNELMEGYTDSTFTVSDLTVDGDITDYVFSATVHQTASGCTSLRAYADTLTVNPNPYVVISGDPLICQDSVMVLTANVTDNYPAAELTYTWKLDNDTITDADGNDTTLTLTLTPRDHAYNFTVVVANAHGCTSESAVFSVVVNPRPVVEVTAYEETICRGGNTVLTANIDNYNLNNLMYRWYTATGDIYGGMQRVITVEPTDTTMYYVEVYQVGSECRSYDSIRINVNEIPVVDSVILSFYEMCYGGQPTITAYAHGGVDTVEYPYFYTWYRNGELIEGVTGATFTDNTREFAVDDDDTYYVYTAVVHQTASGCTSEPTSSDRLNVYMNPRVEVTGDPYVCETDPIFCYANVDTSSINVGRLHYTWYESGQLRDNMAYGYGDSRYFSEYFYARPNPYLISVEVTRGNGCRTMSEQFEVYVHEKPVVEVTANETEICVGGNVTLTANLENYHMEDLTYQWYTEQVDMAHEIYGATQATYTTAALDTTTQFFVRVYRTLSECVAIDGIIINVHADPIIDSITVSDEDTVICAGGEFTLTAHTTVDSVLGVATYTWFRDGVEIEGAHDSVLIEHPVTVDNDSVNYTYTVLVTMSASGCQSVIDSNSTQVITVLPNATVQIEGDPVICGAGDELDTIRLVANVNDTSARVDGFTYEWRLYNRTLTANDPMVVAGADSNVLEVLAAPSENPYVFTVHVWNENGCSTSSEEFPVFVNDTTSIVITASEYDICIGGEVTLFANLGDYNVPNLIYQWYKINNGTIDTIGGATSSTYTTTLDTTTTFFVNLIQTTSSCLSYSELTINVHDDPTVSLAISDEDTIICDGGQFTLTATAYYDTILGAATYTWYRNGFEIENAHGNVLTESPLTVDNDVTVYTYEVIVTLEASGCQSVITDSSTMVVTVYPNPTVEIEGDHFICGAGYGMDTLHLVANVNDTVTADGYTYEWRLFNRTLDNAEDIVLSGADSSVIDLVLPTSDEAYIFTVIVKNENGCTTMSEPFSAIVNEPVVVTAHTTEADICIGGEVTVSAHLDNYNVEGLTYQWYNLADSAAIEGATSATYTTTLDTTTTFYVVVAQPTSSCLSEANVTVNVHADPTVSVAISDADTNICEGGQFTLTATAYYDEELGEPTYTWFRNGVMIDNATGNVLTESPVTVDGDLTNYRYEVLVTLMAAGCQSVITDSSTIDVHVYPNSTVQIEGDPIICGAGMNAVPTTLTAHLNDTVADADGYTYEWRLFNRTIDATDTNVNGVADSSVLSYNLTVSDNPYIFKVIVHNPNGCTNESAEFYVYVNDTANIVVTVDEADICEGGTVTFTANIGDYNMPNLTYQWFAGDTAEANLIGGATQSTYTITLDTAATYTYFVRVYQPTSNCVAYGSESVTVHADPTVSVAISDEDTTICEGGQFTLTATATYDEELGEPVYTWFRNGVIINNATTNVLTESPVTVDNDITAYTYEVIVTLAQSGCQSVVTDSSTLTVTVHPNATVEIAGDHNICGAGEGADHVILTANVNDTLADVDGYTYEWRLFNNTLGFTTNELDTVLESNDEPYFFTVIVRNENGCTTTSERFDVTVHEPVVVTALTTEADICVGGQVTVSAMLDNYNIEGLTYQWMIGADSIEGATNATYTTTLDSTTTFEVLVAQPTTSCLSRSTVTVNVHEDPTVSLAISDEDTVVCEGGQYTLTATAYYDEVLGEATYTWTRNGEEIVDAHGATLTESDITVDGDITTYTYTVIATLTASGCQSVVTDSSTITVTVLPNPTVVIAGDPVICGTGNNATSVQLTANINDHSDLVDGFTYEWRLFNNTLGFTTNELDTVLEPSVDPYIFQVIVHNENGCTTVSATYSVMVNAAPVVNAEAVEADYCVGGTTTLVSHIIDRNAENLTYQWLLEGDTIPGANEETYVTPNDLRAGTYTYTVLVYQTTSDCIGSADVVINVHADPIITDITVSNAVVCDGGAVVVTANADLEDVLGEATYTWYKNGTEMVGITSNTFTDYPTVVDNDVTEITYSAIVTLTASGCTSEEVAAPVVTVNPHATVSVVTDGSLTVCDGGNVTLTANVDPANDTYTYQWYLDNEQVGYDTNVYVAEGLAARETPYMVHVVVTSAPGCVTSTMDQAVAINVVADPVVTLIDIDNNGASTVCVGGTTTLTASYAGGVAQINGLGTPTYTWFNNGEEVGTGNTYVIPTDLTAGTYNYTVVMSFEDNAYGCDVNTAVQGNTGVYTFTVVDDPAPFIAVNVDNDTMVCEGGSTQLYVHHIDNGIEGIDYEYQWYRNGIILAGETNPTLTTDATLPVADYSYYVTVRANGVACDGQSNTIIVSVVTAPTVEITGAANVCVGGQITMSANVDETYGANVTYQWNRVEGGHAQVIAGATESTYTTDTLLALGSYSYSVTVINPISGCTVTSGVVTANVVADPVVTIVNAADVCEGGVVTMTAVVTETFAGAAYNYTWYRDNEVVGANSDTYTTDPALTAGNYVYRVEITPADLNGCNAISEPVNANVIAVPIVTISGYDVVCEGGSVELTANVYPVLNGNSYNYAWYRDGMTLAANTATITTDATLAAGTYTYSVEVWNATYDIDCRVMASFTYTVVADPTIDSIVTSLPDNQMCIGGTVTLTAALNDNLNAANSNVVYTWVVDGRNFSEGTSNTITFTPDHTGTVTCSVFATVNNSYNTGCQSDIQSVNIEVVDQPYVGINYAGILQVCEGGYVELNAVIEGGVGDPTITWRRNSARISEYDGLTTIYTDTNDLVGSYRYSVSVTYPVATGCRATSSEVSVDVLYQPRWTEAVVTTASGNSDICEGERVTLIAYIVGGVEDANHQTGSYIQWVYAPVTDLNDVNLVSCGLGGVSCDYASTPGTYVYYPTYVAPSNTNCAPSNTPNLSGNIITVHEHPTVSMSLGNGSDILCWNDGDDNATINFTFTGTAPFHFSLQDMTSGIITEHTTYSHQYSIEVTPNVTTTYQVFQLSDRYCDGEVVDAATVTVVVSHFEIVIDSVSICPEGDYPTATFTFNNLSVNDSRDTVWFEIDDYNNIGFNYTSDMVNLTDNTVTVYMPTTEPGTYHFGIIIDGCEYDVTVQILWGDFNITQIMDQKWDDVVVCNNNPATNGGHTFVYYQWYRNGVAIPGANDQYYQEVGGLNGFYSLYVIDDQGNEYMTCEVMIATNPQIRVYPVPAHTGVEITVELPFSDEELVGAYLDIFDAKGALVQHVDNLQVITKVAGFEAQGTYFGRIVTGTHEIKTVKFIIVK